MRLLAVLALVSAAHAAAADPARGREIVLGRGDGNCLLCHAVPGAERPAGSIGPSLAGIGARLAEADIAARIADASRFNAQTVMPPYGRSAGLHAVAPQYRGKPLLGERDIADAAAFLATLR